MASTYTDLGLELMATGENAGTWGTKTNANLNLVEQIAGGYLEVSIAGGVQSTPLDVSDGALTGKAQNRIIKFTGAITGNQTVTLPVLMENFYIIENATTGVYTVELKALTGSGATVTWGTADKGWKILYADGVATNTGIYDTGFSTSAGDVTLTGTQTLTNKTLTSPVFSGTATNFTSTGIDDNATSTSITIDSSENVGIGTVSPSQALDVNGTVKATQFVGGGLNPYRNIIINGDMNIAQRGTSFTGLTGISYNLDRWETTAYTMTGGQYQVDQSTDAPEGFAYSQKISCTTAHTQDVNNQFYIQQQIEGVNSSQLNYFVASPDTVTLSFWVKANLTGSYTCALKLSDNGSVESSTSTRVYNTTYSISSADTWEKKTVTIVLDSAITETKVVNNGFAVSVLWWLGAGTSRDGAAANSWINNGNATTAADNLDLLGNTSNEWYITGVQLEAGTSASDFEFLPYDVNLQRCQRYFQKIESSADWQAFASKNDSTTEVYATLSLPTSLRASPTLNNPNFNYFDSSSSQSNSGGSTTVRKVSNNNSLLTLIKSGFTSITGNRVSIISPTQDLTIDSEL